MTLSWGSIDSQYFSEFQTTSIQSIPFSLRDSIQNIIREEIAVLRDEIKQIISDLRNKVLIVDDSGDVKCLRANCEDAFEILGELVWNYECCTELYFYNRTLVEIMDEVGLVWQKFKRKGLITIENGRPKLDDTRGPRPCGGDDDYDDSNQSH